jgi:hypothetical protein
MKIFTSPKDAGQINLRSVQSLSYLVHKDSKLTKYGNFHPTFYFRSQYRVINYLRTYCNIGTTNDS